MQLRWSPAAVEDLFRIIEYIRQENPAAAQGIASTIYESAGSLKSFPNEGRTGRVDGTRDLPLPPLPFMVVYRIGLSFTVAEKGALPFCPLSRHLRDLRLSELYSVDIVLPTIEGREIWLRRISKLDEEQQKILYQLQLQLPERLEPIQIQKCSADSAIA
jgi:toxin ParE1/3/4